MQRPLRLSLFAAVPVLALAPLSGCAASVSGEVDGEQVATLVSALFTERVTDDVDEDGEEAERTSVGASATSLLDACAVATKRQENFNELREQFIGDLKDALEDVDEDAAKDAAEAFAQGQVDYDVANLPTDYWIVSIGASSLDDGELSGGKAEVAYDELAESDEIRGDVTVCRVNDHPSVDEDDNDFAIVETDADCWSAIEADIEIVKWEEEAAFEAKSTATLGDFEDFDITDPDSEPSDVGDVEISISASHCPSLQDALDDLAQIEEDALED